MRTVATFNIHYIAKSYSTAVEHSTNRDTISCTHHGKRENESMLYTRNNCEHFTIIVNIFEHHTRGGNGSWMVIPET